ncbi:uncharacterized protein LOC111792251 [Cucurbita pepo subsp. pepo]|uniref:uncharacterized protein LOC111792251 n=1 Tax=Cucurbita pepo subsp. pepo TaxID=3664 RepID=UPI000C9D463E|nr:uncharacterized protein LOC111792251 [Cucurbita pepo subsp. pepo]
MSMLEGSDSSHLESGQESKEQIDDLTPEDIAWADSCLIKEIPDILDGNWNHIKDALLEVLDLYPQGFESPLAVSDTVPGGINDYIDVDMLRFKNVKKPTERDSDDPMNDVDSSLSLSFSTNPLLPIYKEEDNVPGGTSDDIDIDIDMLLSNNVKKPTFFAKDSDDRMNETGMASEDQQHHDDIDTSLSLSFNKNPFLPTYKEEVDEKESIQTESSHDLPEIGFEPPINDIFQVWDLNLPPIENDLVEQLNKALSENSTESVRLQDSNFRVVKDFNDDLLDSLIDSISDLSLEPKKY